MASKKEMISLIAVGFAIVIGPDLKILCIIGLYYLSGAIIYLVASLFYFSRYFMCKRRLKRVGNFINLHRNGTPKLLIAFQNWLKHEGFVLRVAVDGGFYLQNKTVKINYYSTLKDRISILPIGRENKDYLIYSEDEELKIKLEDYLAFLTEEESKLKSYNDQWTGITSNLTYTSINEGYFFQNCWKTFTSLQGYLFIIIGLFNIPEDYCTNFYKVLVLIVYFIIEHFL